MLERRNESDPASQRADNDKRRRESAAGGAAVRYEDR